MENRPRIFISSEQDLEGRRVIYDHIEERYGAIFEAVIIERVGSIFPPNQRMLLELAASQLVIFILGDRISPPVRREYEEALAHKKARWIFLQEGLKQSKELVKFIEDCKRADLPSVVEFRDSDHLVELVDQQLRADIRNLFDYYAEQHSQDKRAIEEGQSNLHLIATMLTSGEFKAAESAARKLLDNEDGPVPYSMLVYSVVMQGRLDEALKLLESISRYSDAPFADWLFFEAGAHYNDIARAKEQRLGIMHGSEYQDEEIEQLYIRAIELYKLIDLDRLFGSGVEPSVFYHNLGNHYYGIADFRKARRLYFKAVVRNRGSTEIHMAYANVLWQMEKFNLGLRYYREICDRIVGGQVRGSLDVKRQCFANCVHFEINAVELDWPGKLPINEILVRFLSLTSLSGDWNDHYRMMADWIARRVH